MLFVNDESSCDSMFDDSLDIFSVERNRDEVKVSVPVITVPSPRKKTSTNNEARSGAVRPPLRTKFPKLVPAINSFVNQHGFSAQCKRRSSVGSCGVTLSQI